MEGNTASNILKILIIVLIVAVIVGVVLLAIMLIFGVSMFGVRFVIANDNMNGEPDAKTFVELSTENWHNTEAIDITTKGWDVEVRPFSNAADRKFQMSNECVRVLFYGQYTGFVKGEGTAELKKLVYGRNSYGEFSVLVETQEPDSVWITRGNTRVVVLYDEGVLAGKKVRIHTDSGEVFLGSTSTEYTRGELSEVSVDSHGGTVTVGNIDVTDNLEVTKDNGDLYFKTDITGNLNLSINKGYGTVELKSVGNPNVNTGVSVNLGEIQNSNITFETIHGDLQYIHGNSGLIRGNLVTGSLIVNETEACVMKITNIGRDAIFNSGSGSLYVSSVGGNFRSIMKGNGSINIMSIGGDSTIEAKNGAVLLGLDFDGATGGSKGIKGSVDIVSDGGDVKIKCDDDLSNGVLLKVRAKNSYVELSDIVGRVDYAAIDNGKSRIKASYRSARGESNIYTHNGTIDVNIAQSSKAALKWSTSNRVNIEVSSLRTDAKSSDVFIDINGASNELINTLALISDSGKITVKN